MRPLSAASAASRRIAESLMLTLGGASPRCSNSVRNFQFTVTVEPREELQQRPPVGGFGKGGGDAVEDELQQPFHY